MKNRVIKRIHLLCIVIAFFVTYNLSQNKNNKYSNTKNMKVTVTEDSCSKILGIFFFDKGKYLLQRKYQGHCDSICFVELQNGKFL